jgi:hypothetical protein
MIDIIRIAKKGVFHFFFKKGDTWGRLAKGFL